MKPDTRVFQQFSAPLLLGVLSEAWTATDGCAATPAAGSSSTVGGTISPYWQSWTYDAAGDRKTETDYNTSGVTADNTVTTYNYPAAGSSTDQPTTLSNTTATGPNATAETATYGYNSAGDETSVSGGQLGSETYTWNDQGLLQSATSAAGTTNYAYDADGEQLIMRDPSSTTLTVGDAQLNLLSGSGSVTGTRYYQIGGVNIAERNGTGAVGYLIPDRQGTDQLAISATAAQTITRRQYLPFGGARDGSATTATWVGGDKGYVGGLTDDVTGLETLGARSYDSVNGRFISLDPVFEGTDPTQLAGYDYAGNDPATGSDPTGRCRYRDGDVCLDPNPSKADKESAKHGSGEDVGVAQSYGDDSGKGTLDPYPLCGGNNEVIDCYPTSSEGAAAAAFGPVPWNSDMADYQKRLPYVGPYHSPTAEDQQIYNDVISARFTRSSCVRTG